MFPQGQSKEAVVQKELYFVLGDELFNVQESLLRDAGFESMKES